MFNWGCLHFTCNLALIRYFLWHYALVWICMPVIDRLLFGNSNHPGVHKASTWANHRAGPNPAPAQHSLSRKPAPDANPGGRWVFQMQHIALTRTRPLLTRSLPAQWTFFWAQGQGEELVLQKGWALVRAGTTLAAGQKLYLTKDARDRSHLRQHGNKTKTHVLHLQLYNLIQSAITNNNMFHWNGYKQTSEDKIHKS